MGKHKNRTQSQILLEFMEENDDIAKGFTKKDKALVESLWQQLADSLNSAGPPQKDVHGWRKIWTEWKSEVKKKLSHNNTESRATGGGPFSKSQLTPAEETIARICSTDKQVEGVQGMSVGTGQGAGRSAQEVRDNTPSTSKRPSDCASVPNTEILDNTPSTSKRPSDCASVPNTEILDNTPSTSKRPSDCAFVPNTAKKPRQESTSDHLKRFLDTDTDTKNLLNQKLGNLIEIGKENAISMHGIHESIENGYKTIAKAVTDLKEELSSVSARFLDMLQEKNDLEKQRLERKAKKESGKKH